MSHFSNIVSRSQYLLSEVLQPGDLVVDLTAGNGSDTLFLAQSVGPTGRVLAFDIQEQAISKTVAKLEQAGVSFVRADKQISSKQTLGVTLVCASHEQLRDHLDTPPKGVIANLGYLPGGDETVTTQTASTVAALHCATEALAAGGRIAVVVYPGHPGGEDEGKAVDRLFASLSLKRWQVLRIAVPNSSAAPFLLVAEKR